MHQANPKSLLSGISSGRPDPGSSGPVKKESPEVQTGKKRRPGRPGDVWEACRGKCFEGTKDTKSGF
jgi:hypothetical protein